MPTHDTGSVRSKLIIMAVSTTFVALLSAAIATAQWWWVLVMLVGGLLTSAYVFMVVVRAMAPAAPGWSPKKQVPGYQQAAVLGLALCSFLLGLAALLPVDIAQIGRTVAPLVGSP